MKLKKVPGDFTRHKSFSSSWALVIKEDSVTGEHAVSLAVVDHHPVGVQLGNTIRRSVD